MSIAYMSKQTKRNITAEDKRAAVALTQLWDEYRISHPHFTQKHLEPLLGMSQSMFSQLKNGEVTWSTDHVLKMAAFFGVSPATFKPLPVLDEHLYKQNKEEQTASLKINEREAIFGNVEPGPDIKGRLPLISWVQAGVWMDIVDNFAPGDAEEWIACPVKHSDMAFVLRVRGESMFNPSGRPSFSDGDMIFVDPAVQPANKSFVVVRLNNDQETTFKQLIIEGNEQYLKAINPAWPQQIIKLDRLATISGVVIMKAEKI